MRTHTSACLIYRGLLSVWGDNLGTRKQFQSKTECWAIQHLHDRGSDSERRGKWARLSESPLEGGVTRAWSLVDCLGKKRAKEVKAIMSKDRKWRWAWQVLGTGLLEVKATYLGAERSVLVNRGLESWRHRCTENRKSSCVLDKDGMWCRRC